MKVATGAQASPSDCCTQCAKGDWYLQAGGGWIRLGNLIHCQRPEVCGGAGAGRI
jgi:hypothetical protein